jgi:hypothetical protein
MWNLEWLRLLLELGMGGGVIEKRGEEQAE